jgi:hypothetical protein
VRAAADARLICYRAPGAAPPAQTGHQREDHSMTRKSTYRISFHNQGKVYEIYARKVSQGGLLGFVEVEDIVFGEKTTLVVDPSEEHLKSEFQGVRRTYIPMHAVIRVDEVEKTGPSKITEASGRGEKVTPFPVFTGAPEPKP